MKPELGIWKEKLTEQPCEIVLTSGDRERKVHAKEPAEVATVVYGRQIVQWEVRLERDHQSDQQHRLRHFRDRDALKIEFLFKLFFDFSQKLYYRCRKLLEIFSENDGANFLFHLVESTALTHGVGSRSMGLACMPFAAPE